MIYRCDRCGYAGEARTPNRIAEINFELRYHVLDHPGHAVTVTTTTITEDTYRAVERSRSGRNRVERVEVTRSERLA